MCAHRRFIEFPVLRTFLATCRMRAMIRPSRSLLTRPAASLSCRADMCSALSIEAFSVFVGCHAGGVAERSVEGAGVGESCLSSDEGDGPGRVFS